jgi:hypothetical protein
LARIGLIYEDESIHIAFNILAHRLLPSITEIVALTGGGWPSIVGLAPNLLRTLSVKHLHTPFDCVFVMFDSNCSEPGSRIAHVLDKVGNRTFAFQLPIYHAIFRQVETWLFGDHEALEAAARARIPRVVVPEDLRDPKRHLISLLANNSRASYDRNFLRTVLTAADPDEIARNCPDFARFRQELDSCASRQLPLDNFLG